jgi:hypothetical protein
MSAGALVKGWKTNSLTTYADSYVIGTAKEPPYSYLVLTANITFGGFWSGYPTGTEGLLIFVQDSSGGHTINWNGQLTFVGGSGINLAANSVTAVDVIKSPIGWLGFLRDIPQGTFVTQVNGKTGNATLVAGDLSIADVNNYITATTVEGAIAELYVDIQNQQAQPRQLITTSVTSFDILQQYAQKLVRMTNSSAATVNLNRVNFNPATLTAGAEFMLANRGTSTVTVNPDVSVSLSYANPGLSLSLTPGQSLLFRFVSDNGTTMSFDVEALDAGSTVGLNVLQAASKGAARSALALDVLSSPQYLLPGKSFDGSTMYMNATAASMGISNGQKGTLYLAVRFANAAGTLETLLANDKFTVQRATTGDIVVTGKNSSSTTVLLFATGQAPCASAGFYTILIAWDLTTPATGKIYVNDVLDYTETTFTTGQTLNYNSASWYVGSDSGTANKFTGDMYLLWFDPVNYMSIGTVANRRKFFDANAVPTFLGRKGELPNAAQVGIFHGYAAVPNWKTNRGTFSFTWTDNGTPTASTTQMSGAYAESAMSVYFDGLVQSVDQPTLVGTLNGTGTGSPGAEIALRVLKQNIITSNYQLVASDSDCHLYHPSSDTTGRTITIPSNATVPFPIGTYILIDNDVSAGTLTISITTDTLVLVGSGSTGSRTLAAGGQCSLLKVTATRWRITNLNGLT